MCSTYCRALCLFSLVVLLLPIYGNEVLRVGKIGVREGLLNANIKDIEQDGDGLVWVGTEDVIRKIFDFLLYTLHYFQIIYTLSCIHIT